MARGRGEDNDGGRRAHLLLDRLQTPRIFVMKLEMGRREEVGAPDIEGQLSFLGEAKDEDIDFSDIPEIKSLAGAIMGKLCRPDARHESAPNGSDPQAS